MKLVLADPIGFCFGVHRAVACVSEALTHNKPVYCLGPVIHHPAVVEKLSQDGALVVEEVSQIPQGGTVVIRSHGVGPQVMAECAARNLSVVDATCPTVTRIHNLVAKNVCDGRDIVVIGESKHPEVQGIVGWATHAHVVENIEQALLLPTMDRAAVVVQTTFDQQKLDDIIAAVQTRVSDLLVCNTACNATKHRQQEALRLAQTCDAVLVVGGRSSSNTRKLYDLARAINSQTFWVEDAREIDPLLFNHPETVGIIAGASTPDQVIKEVVSSMSQEKTTPEIPETQGCTACQNGDAGTAGGVADEAAQAGTINPEPCACNGQSTCECTPENNCGCNCNDAEDCNCGCAEKTDAACQCSCDEHKADACNREETTDIACQCGCDEHKACNGEEKASDMQQTSSDEQSFSDQLDESIVKLVRGSVIKGTVVQVTDDEVCVNVGYKSDGIISRRDLTGDPSVNPHDIVHVGDEIEVEIVKVNDGEGNVILSKKNVDARRAWQALADNLDAGVTFKATVTECVKGGLVAQSNGTRVFIPSSHVALRFTSDLTKFIGQELELKVLEMNAQRRQIVASRRLVLEEQAEAAKTELWSKIPEPGTLVHSVVRRISDFGAFCDIGGIDGLLHISDMSWGHPTNPRELLSPGDELTVKILSIDKDRGRVSLGLKQIMPKPWEIVEQKYPIGTVVPGKVVRTTTFGAFVELEPGLDGLVHISQLSKERVEKVEDAVKPGDIVKVIVLDVKPEAKRVSLSIRQAMDDDEPAQEEYQYTAVATATTGSADDLSTMADIPGLAEAMAAAQASAEEEKTEE